MADEKKPSALGLFLSNHGEKAALGVAAAALLAYLVLGVAMAGKDKAADDLEATIKKIEAEKGAEHPNNPAMKAPASKDWATGALNHWNEVKKAASANDWSASLATEFKEKPFDVAVEKPRPVKVPTIAFVSASVALDSVTITWSTKEFTAVEIRVESKTTDFFKITHFSVQRETNGSGTWEVLADNLPANTTVYKDTKIDPKTRYMYRVTSHVEKDTKNRPDVKGMTISTPEPAATQGIWSLAFNNAMKGQAYVTIEKYDKAFGGKVSVKKIHHAGDQIGWWPERGSPDPVPKHFVSLPGGKQVEVDFNTGMELKSVEPVKLPAEIKRCRTKFGPGGAKVGCDQTVEKRTIDTNEIVYTEEGKEKKIHVPSPSVLDQLCEDHGGKKITAILPPGEKEKTPEQIKAEAAQTAAAKREKEADALYKEAEKSEANNKSKAIQIYNRLLKEFAATDFVAKDKKALIEQKLAKLQQ